jgi:hypothetical protein
MSDDLIIGNGTLALITPMQGSTIMGKAYDDVAGDGVLHFGGYMWRVEDAFVCERVKMPTGVPSQFSLSFMTIPLDVFESDVQKVYVMPAMFMAVRSGSALAKLYADTVQAWQLKRSGIVTPDADTVHSINRGRVQ